MVKPPHRRLVDRWHKREPASPRDRYEWLKQRGDRGGRKQGRVYMAVADQWINHIAAGDVTMLHVAEQVGCKHPSITQTVQRLRAEALAAYFQEHRDELADEGLYGWLDIYSMSDEQLEKVVDHFAEWRARHFVTPERTPYVTEPFHRRWIVAILRAIRDHSNLLILSPPRHGKTELLIHFDLFFITRVNPDISIVRVCKSEGLAKKALASEMDHLENNEELIRECQDMGCLDIGKGYPPGRGTGRPWNASEFTVATRTIVGLKSPTSAAVGAGGTLLSRDGDIFVIDDIEDAQTVYTADYREKRRSWFASDLMSRKVSTNSFIYIGSRQHPDDIPGHLIDNPEWEVIVESAHDEAACEVADPDKPENWGKHRDCVLWPEVRPYSWLMGIKHDPERAATYPMIYLNHPTDEDTDIFSRAVVDVAKDTSRITHDEPHMARLNIPAEHYDNDGIYHPIKLIAGLDPSGSGYQASFLWGVDLAAFKLYAIDYENRLGGGLHRAREVIERWGAQYGVRTWVIESNLYHGAFIKDDMIQTVVSRDGLSLIPHETGSNKWDQGMGVGVLARMMLDGQVSIPWGNLETQVKWKLVCSQFINFSRDGARSKSHSARATKTDIVMAAWFPLATMQRWRRDWLAEKVADDAYADPYTSMSDLYTSLYPSISTLMR